MNAGNNGTFCNAVSEENDFTSNVYDRFPDMSNAPLEYFLNSGGDRRLELDPVTWLNEYGCRPWPRPETLTFASSTATTVSERGFAAAGLALEQLVQSSKKLGIAAGCDFFAETLREKIRSLLAIGADEAEIVFSPSGTDSQIHALYVAETLLGAPMVSVIVASDETGSRTIYTATGLHFGDRTAQGAAVFKGEKILGLAEDTEKIEIPLRNENGILRSHDVIDYEVMDAVSEAVGAGRHVLLHIMDTSKFGSRCPTRNCLSQIQALWGQSVQVVVDACQMRLSRKRLRDYLNQGFMVLITGSKFFAGPPLSGALLVPAAACAVMAQNTAVPAELQLYTNEFDWPIAWRSVRRQLPARPNIGQLLRWAAAVEEMRAYYAVPAAFRKVALRVFSSEVSRLIASDPNFQLLPALDTAGQPNTDDEEMAVRTIFPFFVCRRGELLPLQACRRIYQALNFDVSQLLPRSATARQREVAAQRCHIGQPMAAMAPVQTICGTLRISAGARVLSDNWCATGIGASMRKLSREFSQVRRILEKIKILVENLHSLGSMDKANGMGLTNDGNIRRLPLCVAAPARSDDLLERPEALNAAPHSGNSAAYTLQTIGFEND